MVEIAGQRKSWLPDPATVGLTCRNCGCRHFYVVYARRAAGSSAVASAASAVSGGPHVSGQAPNQYHLCRPIDGWSQGHPCPTVAKASRELRHQRWKPGLLG